MHIDFTKIPQVENPRFLGGDGSFLVRAYQDERVKIMQGFLAPGCSIGMHTHECSAEILYLIEGEGSMLLPDGSCETLLPGEVSYCPKGEGHSLRNPGPAPLRFFAVVPNFN